jgi:transcriptional antiterminator RfaH
MDGMAKQWFVGVTKQGGERLARRELLNQNFEVYLPLYIKEWTAKPLITPFLPGYIFIRMDPVEQRWQAALSTFGMRTVIYANDRPLPVPDAILEGIRAREVDGIIRLPPKLESKFKKGDAVRARGSPLDLVFGEMIDSKRAAVFLSLLGRSNIRKIILTDRLHSSNSVRR